MKIASVKPWLVEAPGTYWGEFLFVEVSTDEGVTGWGEITTTTPVANRVVAGTLRQISELIAGDDPARIEEIWHKIFRSFTYMGSRGATSHCISGIDIALWDIRGKVLGVPIYDLLGGKVRDDILLYCHPDQSKFTDPDGVRAGDPRADRFRPHLDEVRSVPAPRRPAPAPQRLSRRRARPRRGGDRRRPHRPDPRHRRAADRDPDRRARPLQRADRDKALPQPGERRRRSTGSRSRCRSRAIMRSPRCARR